MSIDRRKNLAKCLYNISSAFLFAYFLQGFRGGLPKGAEARKTSRTLVKADGKGMYNSIEVDTNFVSSYYGRDGFDGFIDLNVASDTFLFIFIIFR